MNTRMQSERDEWLLSNLEAECSAIQQCEYRLCTMMRRTVRRLINHTSSVLMLETPTDPSWLIGVDVAPRLARALRLAARTVEAGSLLRNVQLAGPIIVEAASTRRSPIGPRLRPITPGRVALHVHSDERDGSQSAFVLLGVFDCSDERAVAILRKIIPTLHRALVNLRYKRIAIDLGLTPAERIVCRLLLEAGSNKELARALNKSVSTVRNQLHAIFEKLDVNTRTAAIGRLRDLSIMLPGATSHTISRNLEQLFY